MVAADRQRNNEQQSNNEQQLCSRISKKTDGQWLYSGSYLREDGWINVQDFAALSIISLFGDDWICAQDQANCAYRIAVKPFRNQDPGALRLVVVILNGAG
jgi:hypothetical protein